MAHPPPVAPVQQTRYFERASSQGKPVLAANGYEYDFEGLAKQQEGF
jgi:hypothetical protein